MPGLFYAVRASAQMNHPSQVQPGQERTAARASPSSASRASPKDGYVGSIACSRCHAEIYNHFSRTSMGRSLTPVTAEFLQTVPLSASIYDPKSDRHFEVHNQDGKLYQSEYQTDAAGHEVFRNTHAIDWIVGANANGLGALIRHDDYLFEAPLSYYAKAGAWELSPGYQNGDYGFSRSIAPGCIFCHSGRPQPVAGSDGKYGNPAFTQEAIGCENCHGPGSAHVQAMGLGDSYARGKDPTIVNPGNLSPALANDICMSCHQTGDTRVFQPGKTYQDFRPGQPLDRVLAILMVPPTRDKPPSEDHVQHYYSMILSKCYRASANKPAEKQMRCISCHDPHVEPASAEAPAFFNGKCMSCHTEQSCKAPAQARAQTSPADNCIGCHMQKRAGGAISHTSLTNHRILARPGEPFPDEAFQMATAALPDLIYLNARPGDTAPPAGITLLQAYGQLKDQSPVYAASYLRTLHELEATAPENAIVQAALGHQALAAGQLEEAAQHLRESLKLDPMQPVVYGDLSAIADQKGQTAEALALAQKAVALDPFNAPIQKTLVLRLINAKEYPEAEAAMEKYMENFPEDDFMRKMLAIAKQD
jgi:tetratricopeptide (TPR) repeat protein